VEREWLPQWGLSFVERPPENRSGISEHAKSPRFLWAMMVEWSFAMHDDHTPTNALARLLSVEIRTATPELAPQQAA
jgi:hypothetical protein